ncbi:protease inhibitor I42 family protein [Nonomuraea typhae]|uniref:protease inhibitor I42 family protein n=1 Tax=Nonomuraea typhae TaxID=2603600 RepID=UPI001FE8E637|nr:protease inhibitor I42 family protein [Nonomuraea typhae]
MKRTWAAAALLAVTAAGCGAGSAVSDYGTVIKGGKGQSVPVEVGQGQRFSLTVPDNPSVGDQWSLVEVPDAKVASFISEEHESEGGAPGSNGTGYFVFNAKRQGTTVVKLYNCWRCGTEKTPSAPDSIRESGTATFTVTVK